MQELSVIAPAFVDMAHRIVWCSAASVDERGRPRTRILHPFWVWDGVTLVGWIATSPTPLKRRHLAAHPYLSISYWAPTHDTCGAECKAALMTDDETRTMVWNLFLNAPEPVGYDPRIIPAWTSPTADAFAALRLEPYRLRLMEGKVMMGQPGNQFKWRADNEGR